MYDPYSWRDRESKKSRQSSHGKKYSKRKVTPKTYGRGSKGNRKVTGQVQDDTGDVFTSGMTVHETLTVEVPDLVRDICISIQEEVGRPEWGALFKGEWTENGFEVKPEYVIPEQKVSRAHIHYEEDLKKYRDRGYVVNIHSHPFSGRSAGFSGTDDEHINSHFTAALLYAGKAEDIVDGIVNVTVKDGVKVQVDAEVEVNRDGARLPDVDISNINKQSPQTGSGTSQTSFKYTGNQQSTSGYSSEESQNEDSEEYTVKAESNYKISESRAERYDMDAEDFEDIKGVTVVPDEEYESSESEE